MDSIVRRVGTKVCGSTTDLLVLSSSKEEYPLFGWGNRFSLKMVDGNSANVLNMFLENFEEICERKQLTTIEVLYLPEHRSCFVVDSRVPRDWLEQ